MCRGALQDGTAQLEVDCSGGGRLVHIEYLEAATFNGKYQW
jgi:hypothetical protein